MSYSPEAIWAIVRLIEELFNPLELLAMANKLYDEVVESHHEGSEAKPSEPSEPTNEEIKHHA